MYIYRMFFRINSLILSVLLFFSLQSKAQDDIFIDIRGEVLSMNGKGVPFVNVFSTTGQKGTAADFYGKFRMFVQSGDTLKITAVGFRPSIIPIPPDLPKGIYPLRITLSQDTIELSEAVITPWPENWQEFRAAFLALDVPNESFIIEIPQAALKQAIRDAKPGGGITMPGPVSILYEAFSRDAKKRRKLEALEGESNRFEIICRSVGQNGLANLCGSKERDKMESFVARCNLSDVFIAQANKLELIEALMHCADCSDTTNQEKTEQ